MVLFKRYHIWPMHMGIKTYTRRFWKKPHVKIGKWYPATHKMYYQPEDVVGQIFVEGLYKQSLGMMTEQDAYDEGGYSLAGYKRTLEAISKKPWDDCSVPWVVKFRFVLSDIIDGNGGTAEIDEYKREWEAHVKEMQTCQIL
jgi:hypothetical protein